MDMMNVAMLDTSGDRYLGMFDACSSLCTHREGAEGWESMMMGADSAAQSGLPVQVWCMTDVVGCARLGCISVGWIFRRPTFRVE